jgi:hypothetical protein
MAHKALSVKNPWAYWIVYGSPLYGIKDVENRRYPTNYRGRLLIHASKNLDVGVSTRDERQINGGMDIDWDKYKGRILGSVELIDCINDSKSRWAEAGMWHWVFRNPIIFENPTLASGSLGLWNYDPTQAQWYEMMRSAKSPVVVTHEDRPESKGD